MTIPCDRCNMKNSCRQDGRCRRPASKDAAMHEMKEALIVFTAPTKRLNEATAGLMAATAIEKSQQP